jgi:hypothetical protein
MRCAQPSFSWMPSGSWLTVALILFAAFPLKVQATRCPYNFTPTPQDPSQFNDALFRIHTQDAFGRPVQGTAFLIDLNGGYLLTAGHIVEDTPPNGDVLAVHGLGRFKLRLRQRMYMKEQFDAALLQFEPADLKRFVQSAGARARVVEVALDFKQSLTKTMSGFPNQTDPDAPLYTPNHTPTKLTYAPPGQYALSGNAPLEGESGGPLFDENGFAIGVIHGGVDGHGQFTMLADIQQLLEPTNIPLSQNAVRSLSVLASAHKVDPVVTELKPPRLSNLEMIGVGETIGAGLYQRFKLLEPMLGCPVNDAFYQRSLVPVLDDIVRRTADNNIKAVGLLRSGESAMNRGLLQAANLKIWEGRTIANRGSDVELKRWASLAAADSEVKLCGAGFRECNLTAAVDSAQTALKLSGSDKKSAALANEYLGQAYALANNRDKAVNFFDRAYRFAPDAFKGYGGLNSAQRMEAAPDAVEILKPQVYRAPQTCAPGALCG